MTLKEWDEVFVEGLSLSTLDRRALSDGERRYGRRVVIDELRQGVRVRSTSWAGVLQLDSCEVHIIPKLPGETLDLVRLLQFTKGASGLVKSVGTWHVDQEGENLLDLITQLLADQAERLVREGLIADYRERESEQPVLRGRLLPERQLRKRFGQFDRMWCRFDEREQDVLDNQLVALGLQYGSQLALSSALRSRVRRLRAIFDEICDVRALGPGRDLERLEYHRLNEHYREAHELSRLLLRGIGPQDLYRTGQRTMFAFLLDMNDLFEAFVARWLEVVLRPMGVTVQAQRAIPSVIWRFPGGTPYGNIRPDVALHFKGTARSLPVDAKYKRYTSTKVSPADIYQGFVYAYAYCSQGAGRAGVPAAVVVFPLEERNPRAERLEIRSIEGIKAADIKVIGLPIPRALAEVAHGPGEVTEFVVRQLVE